MLAKPLFAALAAWVLVLGLIQSAWSQTLPPEALAVHAVNRLSFGAVPGEIDRVRTMGVPAYVQEQLNPEKLPEPQALTDRLQNRKAFARCVDL